MVKARPILMSGPMVRACLDGTKSQTRRVIKEARDIGARCTDEVRPFGGGSYYICAHDGTHMIGEFRCPYGQPGDYLYVREAFIAGKGVGGYQAGVDPDKHPDGPTVDCVYRATYDGGAGPWSPSIHMPRWASRLTLRITDVRVERLQDISEADAQAEGAARLVMDDEGKFYERDDGTYRMGFYGVWEHLNAKRAPWDSNPWVWCLSFFAIRKNIDEVLADVA